MSTDNSSGDDVDQDVECCETTTTTSTVLIVSRHEAESRINPQTTRRERDPWRFMFLIFRARRLLMSSKCNAPTPRESSSALAETETLFSSTLEILIDAPGELNTNDNSKGLEIDSPPVVIDIHSVAEDESNITREAQQETIAGIVKRKDLSNLTNFGGVKVVAEALGTDLEKGIPVEDVCSRRKAIKAPVHRFFKILMKSSMSLVVLLLLLSAILSLSFGINVRGSRTGWYGGVIMIVAVIIIVVISTLRDFLQERTQILVDVIRGGRSQKISISEVVCGDLVCLKEGYDIPADGLYVSGEFLELDTRTEPEIDDRNPFLFYGSKVLNGDGRMIVTSVGGDAALQELMSKKAANSSKTPFQAELDKLRKYTQIGGLIVSIFILLVWFLHFKLHQKHQKSGLPELKGPSTSSKNIMEAIHTMVVQPCRSVRNLTTSLVALLVGIVEGLPSVVTLAILYWKKKLVPGDLTQNLSALISTGSVTTICIHETADLTLNSVEVDTFCIAEEYIKEESLSKIAPEVIETLCEGISTTFAITQTPLSSTDKPIYSWARLKFGTKKLNINRETCTVTDSITSEERIGIKIRKSDKSETTVRSHWKGHAPTILGLCTCYYDGHGKLNVMTGERKRILQNIINEMQIRHLQTIAFAFKRDDETEFDERNLILIGIFGLKHLDSRKTIDGVKNAGISIKFVSHDSVTELNHIAGKYGILMPGSPADLVQAEDFRKWTNEVRMKNLDAMTVMERATPEDWELLVQSLKQKGHTVAVVRSRTTDNPALKDVVLVTGSWNIQLAREDSDRITWDSNSSSLVSVIMIARCVHHNIQKYIQLELTVIVAGLIVNSMTTILLGRAIFTSIQLTWAYYIVTIFGGFALLSDPPKAILMRQPPVRPARKLINNVVWRNIATQTIYQVSLLVAFQCRGQVILRIDHKVRGSMTFNTFVLCQVLNILNARGMKMKHVFEHWWFWVALLFMLVLQAAFVEISGILPGNARLNLRQWGICLLIAVGSNTLHLTGKCASDLIRYLFAKFNTTTTSTPLEPAYNLELPLL